MFSILHGDMFSAKTEAIVNPVNCVGVMGAGVALQFKRRWPAMFTDYQYVCKMGQLDIGKLHVYQHHTLTILNVPTKHHWRNPSKLSWVVQGVTSVVEYCEANNINSVTWPLIGCGCGGLAQKDVVTVMHKLLTPGPVNHVLYLI